MLSKQPAISASNTNLGLTLIAAKTASMASWTERPGRNPYELGSKRASHSGSRASQTSVCAALVRIVGMPSGRFSVLPGLGIHTRRLDCGLSVRLSVATRARRWDGVRALTPSTPAVFLPRLSCVTRRTARHFADQDFISNCSSRWTARWSPRWAARKIRFWSFQTVRWIIFQGRSFHSDTGGEAAVLSDILTRFAPLPSIHRDPSGQIPLITPPCLFGRASPGCPRGLRGESLGFVGHPAISTYQRAASPRSTARGQSSWFPRSCCSSSASGRTALSAGLLWVHARSYDYAPSPRAAPVLGQPVQIPCHAGWPSHLRWIGVATVVLRALPARNTYDVRSRVSLHFGHAALSG